jgi:AcrR family transcriptional regulator
MADGSHRTPRTAGDKRERILDAALELFSTYGFHGTAVPAIAKGAGVGAGTIYRYFESKEVLVNELFRREKERLLGTIMADFPANAPARDQFHFFLRKVVDYAAAHRASFEFLEHHHHAPYLDGQSCMMETRVIALAGAFLCQTTKDRITKPVASGVLMSIVWGAVIRLVKDSWAGQVVLDDSALDEAETVLWEAIRL